MIYLNHVHHIFRMILFLLLFCVSIPDEKESKKEGGGEEEEEGCETNNP